MPLYEYRCTKCGHRFEKIQSFSSTPETECPECCGALERPLTAPALQFKGAGWYVNDYAGKSSASAPNSDGSKSEATKDAKPATGDATATGASTASTTESSAKSNAPASPASST